MMSPFIPPYKIEWLEYDGAWVLYEDKRWGSLFLPPKWVEIGRARSKEELERVLQRLVLEKKQFATSFYGYDGKRR
jgi:hypothetical protein